MTLTLSIQEAKEELNELLSRVSHQRERIIITRRDKEIAVIIPFAELELLEQSQNKHDVDEALEALRQARAKGFYTFEDLIEKIGY